MSQAGPDGVGGARSRFKRYLLSAVLDGRKRWWKGARAHRSDAPACLLPMLDDPAELLNLDEDEVLEVNTWAGAHGLHPPAIALLDIWDPERPNGRLTSSRDLALAREYILAYAAVYATWSMRDVLRARTEVLAVWPDSEDDDRWHCGIVDSAVAGASWWQGRTPALAVEAAIRSGARDLLGWPDEAVATGAE